MTDLPRYPIEWVESITLSDGTQVTLRPIRPQDARLLQEGFKYLSPDTIYYRFLEPIKALTDEQAQQLATLDYQSHMAFVATILENGQERIIAEARYALVGPQEPGAAETAVTVQDDFQKRGLGSLLSNRLIRYAQLKGVKYFTGTIHQSNAPIMRFIRSWGQPVEREIVEPGVIQFRVRIVEDDPTA
jgi:acetyltransferase